MLYVCISSVHDDENQDQDERMNPLGILHSCLKNVLTSKKCTSQLLEIYFHESLNFDEQANLGRCVNLHLATTSLNDFNLVVWCMFFKKKIASIILFVVVHTRHNCDASVGFEPSLLSGHMNLYIFWEEKLQTSI